MVVEKSTNEKTLDPSEWLDRYGDYLYRYAASRLRDSEAAEEVVQETFLAGIRYADQFAGKGSEQAWLLGILKRKVIDFVRTRNRSTTADEQDLSDALFDSKGNWKSNANIDIMQPSDSLERKEFWAVLQGCIQNLPTKQADAFVLRELDEQSTDEICKDLEISASNLWVMLYRARLQLSKCISTRWLEKS